MTPATRSKIGYTLCGVGLAVAFLSMVPAVVPYGTPPWPIFFGSAIYIPGAFLVFFSSKGADRNRAFSNLRLIRFGFLIVIAVLIVQLVRS